MSTTLLIILLIISVIMTGLILIQQSEGGALGIGGGGGGGGLMSGRSAANSVSRMTGILGGVFLITCLALSVIMTNDYGGADLLEQAGEVGTSENSTENPPVTGDEPLTTQSDSGETTIPLASENIAVESGDTPDDISEEMPAEPAETPEDE